MPPLTKGNKDEITEIVASILTERDKHIADLELEVARLDLEVTKLSNDNILINKSVANLGHDMNLNKKIIDQLRRSTDDQNQYSRKQNLILDGIKFKKYESL